MQTRQERKDRALRRQEMSDRLSDEEKLERALRKGHNDSREVKRLRARIEAKKNTEKKEKGAD